MEKALRDTLTNALRAITLALDGAPAIPLVTGRQLDRISNILQETRKFQTLGAIAFRAGCSTASASARIRDLRNLCGYTIESRRPAGGGSYEYRFIG